MVDFILSILSSVLQMNMRDHHDIPFGLPLVMACMSGFVIGFIILNSITKEDDERKRLAETGKVKETTDFKWWI